MIINVNKREATELIEYSLASEKRKPIICYQTKESNRLENYLKTYADKVGYYFVTLDEFTARYISEVAELYHKMSDSNYCIIYIKMCDYIDYSTTHQRQAMSQLTDIVRNPKYNMQIIIDVALLDNPQVIHDACKCPFKAYHKLLLATGMITPLVEKCLEIYLK